MQPPRHTPGQSGNDPSAVTGSLAPVSGSKMVQFAPTATDRGGEGGDEELAIEAIQCFVSFSNGDQMDWCLINPHSARAGHAWNFPRRISLGALGRLRDWTPLESPP